MSRCQALAELSGRQDQPQAFAHYAAKVNAAVVAAAARVSNTGAQAAAAPDLAEALKQHAAALAAHHDFTRPLAEAHGCSGEEGGASSSSANGAGPSRAALSRRANALVGAGLDPAVVTLMGEAEVDELWLSLGLNKAAEVSTGGSGPDGASEVLPDGGSPAAPPMSMVRAALQAHGFSEEALALLSPDEVEDAFGSLRLDQHLALELAGDGSTASPTGGATHEGLPPTSPPSAAGPPQPPGDAGEQGDDGPDFGEVQVGGLRLDSSAGRGPRGRGEQHAPHRRSSPQVPKRAVGLSVEAAAAAEAQVARVAAQVATRREERSREAAAREERCREAREGWEAQVREEGEARAREAARRADAASEARARAAAELAAIDARAQARRREMDGALAREREEPRRSPHAVRAEEAGVGEGGGQPVRASPTPHAGKLATVGVTEGMSAEAAAAAAAAATAAAVATAAPSAERNALARRAAAEAAAARHDADHERAPSRPNPQVRRRNRARGRPGRPPTPRSLPRCSSPQPAAEAGGEGPRGGLVAQALEAVDREVPQWLRPHPWVSAQPKAAATEVATELGSLATKASTKASTKAATKAQPAPPPQLAAAHARIASPPGRPAPSVHPSPACPRLPRALVLRSRAWSSPRRRRRRRTSVASRACSSASAPASRPPSRPCVR